MSAPGVEVRVVSAAAGVAATATASAARTAARGARGDTGGTLTGARRRELKSPACVWGGSSWRSAGGGQGIVAAGLAVAPDWMPSVLRHDAALVTLSAPTAAPPVALAGPANGALVRTGADLLVTGWGRQNEEPGTGADVLAQTMLALFPDDACGYLRRFDATVMVCAGARGAVRAVCRGDSGGAARSASTARRRWR